MLKERTVVLTTSLLCKSPRRPCFFGLFKAELYLNCESEPLVSCVLSYSSACCHWLSPNVTSPSCLCSSISRVHFVDNECNGISLAFEKLTFTSQLSISRGVFSIQGILASILCAWTASTIQGLLAWYWCSHFLHPQQTPSKRKWAQSGEWLSF